MTANIETNKVSIFTTACSDAGSVVIMVSTQEGKIWPLELSPADSNYLRNLLAAHLGPPKPEDLLPPYGRDLRQHVLDNGGSYYDGETGETVRVTKHEGGMRVIEDMST